MQNDVDVSLEMQGCHLRLDSVREEQYILENFELAILNPRVNRYNCPSALLLIAPRDMMCDYDSCVVCLASIWRLGLPHADTVSTFTNLSLLRSLQP